MSVPFPAPDGPVTTKSFVIALSGAGGRPARRAGARTSPPTVFDWLIRHWFKKRAAFTRPNFGTAISMSNTFAVSTYAGGLRSICSIWALPLFRSFFSWARRTRISLARRSASIL